MEIVIDEESTKEVKKAVDMLDKNLDEMTMKVSEENGIQVKQMDESKIALLDVKIEPSNFKDIQAEETAKVKVRAGELKKALKNLKDKEVTIEEQENKLVIKGGNQRYEIPILSMESRDDNIPEVDFDIEIEVDKSDLKKKIGIAGGFSNHLKFRANGDLEIEAEEESAYRDIVKEDIEVDEEIEVMFPISYLKNLVPKMSEITMSLKSDCPLKMYSSEDGVVVESFLAPRVEE